jgi:nitrogen fixation protein NifU and related proteins
VTQPARSETPAADIYQAAIMDRARRPRHQKLLEAAVVEAEERNPLCGDRVLVQLDFTDDGRIAAFGYRARACAICIAATDLIAEIVPGMDSTSVNRVAASFETALRRGDPIPGDSTIASFAPFAPLHDTPSRLQCALLGWQAVAAAFAKYKDGFC